MCIAVLVSDSIRIHFFHFQIFIAAKMSLFWEFIWAHHCILIRRKKDILILEKGPTEWLDDTTSTAKARHSINFSRSNRKFFIKEAIVFLFVNAKKIYQFKRKHSEINKYLLCFENISGDFSPYSMKKKQN